MKLIAQIGILFGICLVGEGVARLLPFAVPASVLSMILLFVLLLIQWLKPDHIQQQSDFLLKNMAFFFIPAGVAIMNQFAAIRNVALILLLISLLSTVVTFGATALTVKAVMAWQNKRKRQQDREDGLKGGAAT